MRSSTCHLIDLSILKSTEYHKYQKLFLNKEDTLHEGKHHKHFKIVSDTFMNTSKVLKVREKVSDKCAKSIPNISKCYQYIRCIVHMQLSILDLLVRIINIHQSLLSHKLVYNGNFQTLDCRYSFGIQPMWLKFCVALVTGCDLLL